MCSCREFVFMVLCAVVAVVLIGPIKKLLSDMDYERQGEFCGSGWINDDVKGVQDDFNSQLHGQHFVITAVTKALHKHLRGNPRKPLVMSFHGSTGVGKNFVSGIIVNNLYVKGFDSKFVHLLIGPKDFMRKDLEDKHINDVKDLIRREANECDQQMFIFDEVDKISGRVMRAVMRAITSNGSRMRKSIFIFLSNTGGTQISQKVLQLLSEGRNREDISLDDMQELITTGAFQEADQNSFAQSNVIDYYVPFLPLERKHVKLCVQNEMKRQRISPEPERLKSNYVERILNEMPYTPEDTKLFSKYGCKTVMSKVSYYYDDIIQEGQDRYRSSEM